MNDAMQAQQRLIQAMQNYQMGDLGAAERELQDLRRKFPKSDQILAMLGAVHFAQKKNKDAFRAYREALKINPHNEEAAVGIGSTEHARGNTANAIKLLIEATRKYPKRADALFNLGMIYIDKKDFKKAEGVFKSSLIVEPRLVQSHLSLVNIYKSWDQLEKVEYHLKAAIAINPAPELQQKLDEIIALRGEGAKEVKYEKPDLPDSEETAEQTSDDLSSALGVDAKDVNSLISAAQDFLDNNKFSEAEKLLEQILAVEPENAAAKLGMRRIKSTRIPMWHFEMLADTTRNDAYQQAIEKAIAIRPGSRVLDIGTGSGLLSMMAARAGASEVLACEMNADLAKAATGIIKDNGYADKVRVLNKMSSDLKKGKDFEEPYDIVVSEILDVGGLGEGVIPSLRHARQHLLKSGAVTIPSGITMHAQLVEAPDLYSVNPVKKISGFDLSGFDQFRPTVKYFQIWIDKEEHTLLSESSAFQSFDFYNIPKERSREKPHVVPFNVKTTGDGMVQAVIYWFDLHLDDEIQLSSGPKGDLKHWGQAICYLDEPVEVKEGDEVSLKAMLSDALIWFEND